MANTYVNVTPEKIKEIVEMMIETYAPTKKRKTHKIKVEIELALDAFKDGEAITDFGAIVMLHINDKYITPEFSK